MHGVVRTRIACAVAIAFAILGIASFASAVLASETVTYTYDARGRLIQASHAGTVNDGLSSSYGYDKADNRQTVTISGASGPSFAINDVSVTEGGTLVFTVTKSGSTASSISVNFATADGSATAGSDYTATSGTLTFASTDTSKTISIATADDSAVESAETLSVNLSGATGGATISDGQGVGTIVDNDSPQPPSFAINDVTVTEGGTLLFTVTKTGSTTGSFSVNYATANGTATAGSDYTATSGTLTFASTDTTKTISVATTDDSAVEAAETLNVNLSGATGGATITDSQGIGTINDNDASFAINDVSVTEGGALVFTVTKTGSNASNFSVNFATSDGTAIAGSDYAATSGTLNFAPTDTTKSITVATTDDTAVEAAETLTVNLSGATGGATISASQGTGTINDNDASFAINDVSVTEGGTLVFTVTKTGSNSTSFNVNYATADGTAIAGSDYTAASGTLIFSPTDTTKTVSVSTIDDTTVESAENLFVNLSGATGGATISDSQGIGTINDNDVANNPPVANPDSASVATCTSATINVVQNDTDPDGDLPLTLIAVSSGNFGFTSVASSTSVGYDAGGSSGTDHLTYTIRDSRGATATGSLQVAVFSHLCNAPAAAPGGNQ